MNPLTITKNIKKLSEQELKTKSKKSWHDQYRSSAWIFIGGLPFDLTEGDIICVFSQYGNPVNINLVRDKDSGKSKGFCFLCYEDQRSTDLAVDNLNAIKILGRTIRVDHVNDYKPPKERKNDDEITKKLKKDGCADVPVGLKEEVSKKAKVKKEKKEKKRKKKDKEKEKETKKRKKLKEEEEKVKKELEVTERIKRERLSIERIQCRNPSPK